MNLTTAKQAKIQALAIELSKDLKTPADLSQLTADLTKMTIEAALNAELDHLTLMVTITAIAVMDIVLKNLRAHMVK
jgi:hypothetical protein